MIKKIILLLLVLLLMPLAFANIYIECAPLTVSSGEQITCNVKTEPLISNVGVLDLKVNPGSHVATAVTSSVGTGFLNTNSASPQYNSASFIASSGVNFDGDDILATITLTAGSSSSVVSLDSLSLTDFDSYGPISYGVLTPSDMITITSATTPPACSDECASGATQCSGNQVQNCVTNADADSCREWGAASDCLSGQTCQNDACVTLTPPADTVGSCVYDINCGEGKRCVEVKPGVSKCRSVNALTDKINKIVVEKKNPFNGDTPESNFLKRLALLARTIREFFASG